MAAMLWHQSFNAKRETGRTDARPGRASAVAVLLAVLDNCHLGERDAIDAIRVLRVAMHGFTILEAAGGFGLPQSVDATFTRLVDALDATFTRWAEHRA
jgi:hypothetical protein